MELVTTGIQHSPGFQFPHWYNAEEHFQPEMGVESRLRVILIEQGSGQIRLGQRRLGFLAPALLCLNEQESPVLEHSAGLRARGVYFHPTIINSSFDFETLRQTTPNDVGPVTQDRSSLRAFLARHKETDGLLNLGPTTAARVLQLFEAIRCQLLEQPDPYWICRSRSFLLELLTITERLHMAPDALETPEPAPASHADTDQLIKRILTYLHTHYQQKITISELTSQFHTNRTTLTEQFHKQLGMPVMMYLALLRMRQASLLLRDTNLPVAEVMTRVGYQDSTNFWRSFRKHIGYSPAEYRDTYSWLIRRK